MSLWKDKKQSLEAFRVNVALMNKNVPCWTLDYQCDGKLVTFALQYSIKAATEKQVEAAYIETERVYDLFRRVSASDLHMTDWQVLDVELWGRVITWTEPLKCV